MSKRGRPKKGQTGGHRLLRMSEDLRALSDEAAKADGAHWQDWVRGMIQKRAAALRRAGKL